MFVRRVEGGLCMQGCCSRAAFRDPTENTLRSQKSFTDYINPVDIGLCIQWFMFCVWTDMWASCTVDSCLFLPWKKYQRGNKYKCKICKENQTVIWTAIKQVGCEDFCHRDCNSCSFQFCKCKSLGVFCQTCQISYFSIDLYFCTVCVRLI